MSQEHKPLIIALHGEKESGKTTAARALDLPVYSFAEPLRLMLKVLLLYAGVSYSDLSRYLRGDKTAIIPAPVNVSGRHLMQTLGTEWGREHVRGTLWSDLLIHKVMSSAKGIVVIDDLRFPEEHEALAKYDSHTLFVKIVRPALQFREKDPHLSEQGLADELFDLVLVNDCASKQEFGGKVTQAIGDLLLARGVTLARFEADREIGRFDQRPGPLARFLRWVGLG